MIATHNRTTEQTGGIIASSQGTVAVLVTINLSTLDLGELRLPLNSLFMTTL